MNVASGGLLGVAVGYSGWADRQMAGWKLPVLQHCGTCWTGSGVTAVNSCQWKSNVKVQYIAVLQIVVLLCGVVVGHCT